jgi:Leucine-rich repeat (LRR) protein
MEASRQRETFKWIKAHGGFVKYQPYEAPGLAPLRKPSAAVQWLHKQLGVDYFETIYQVFLIDADLTDISPLANLKHLQCAHLDVNYIADIAPLAALTDLKQLSIDDNQVSNLSPLGNLTSLEFLSIERNEVERLDALANLHGLQGLRVDNNYLEDIECVKGLVALTSFTADYNNIRDATPLTKLPKLKMIRLHGNPLAKGAELGD